MITNHIAKIEVSNGVFAVYNVLVGDIVYVTEDEYNNLKNGKLKEIDSRVMIDKKIIVNDNYDSYRITKTLDYYNKHVGDVDYVVVMMTNACNLACEYCIENAYLNGENVIFLKENTINHFFEAMSTNQVIKINKQVQFVLYGGEPLLNYNGIKYFFEKSKEYYPDSSISIVTNGTLIDEEKAMYFKEKGIRLGISVDGPREITNSSRKSRDGSMDIYSNVMSNINILKKHNVNWGISLTVTDVLLDNADDFIRWITEVSPQSISFNVLKLCFEKVDEKMMNYYLRTADFICNMYDSIVGQGIQEELTTMKIKLLASKSPVFADCAAAIVNQITLNADGNLYTCQCRIHEDRMCGSVFCPNDIIISEYSKNLSEYIPYNRKKCLNCFALPICGGGCPVQAMEMFDEHIDVSYCEYIKKIMMWLLKKIYSSIK